MKQSQRVHYPSFAVGAALGLGVGTALGVGLLLARPSLEPSRAAATPSPTSSHAASTPSATPTLTPAVSARTGASAAFHPPSGKLVMFGGTTAFPVPQGSSFEPAQVSGETWTWDGRAWYQEHPATSPPGRTGAGLVYDAGHTVLVLYGGSGPQGVANDTWTWDGTNWKQMSPVESPPAWYFATMTYDSTINAVMLYAGAGWCRPMCNAPINQTWKWDGTTWTQIRNAGDPNGFAVQNAAIAYHSASGHTFFVSQTGTWELDTAWRRVSGGGTVLGSGTMLFGPNLFALADDTGRGVLLELGTNSDTWAWDGKAWTALNPPAAPPVRVGEAMAYDSARKQVVLFGGAASSPSSTSLTGTWTLLSDTWVWDGRVWTRVA